MQWTEHDDNLGRAAYAAWKQEDWATAAANLQALLNRHPDTEGSDGWWYDAALAHKFMRNWPQAYELGKQAAARAQRGQEAPAFWNLGIAATIIGDWHCARDSWAGYGITLEPGAGEINQDLGPTCIRLEPDGESEVVWARRICPTRARIVSIPMVSDRSFGDIILHDGAPNGERVVNEHRYPVFDELLVWRESEIPANTVILGSPTADDLQSLIDIFDKEGFAAEPQSSAMVLCKCCSESTVTQESATDPGRQTVWLAAPQSAASHLLKRWHSHNPASRAWHNLHQVERT